MTRQPEVRFSELLEAGDHTVLAGELVGHYGPELLGYIQALLRHEDAAQEAFQAFCEDLLLGLPNFRAESSFRTWLYVLARNRALKQTRGPSRVPLSRSPEVDQLVMRSRTATAPYVRTEVKNAVRRLQDQLSPDERSLLILRIDRDMAWNEIAQVLGEGEATPADVARIRKRFQRTKDKLRRLAEEAGILSEGRELGERG